MTLFWKMSVVGNPPAIYQRAWTIEWTGRTGGQHGWGRLNEWTNARTPARTHARTHARTNERTNARTNKRTNARTHARTNERTNERTNSMLGRWPHKGKVILGNCRSLDSRTTMRTRLNFKFFFFRIFSKSRHPRKLHYTFFNQKSSIARSF